MPAAGVVYSCASWLVTKGMENGEDRERLLSVLSNGTYMMCLMQATGGGEGIQERGLLVVLIWWNEELKLEIKMDGS